MLFTAGLGTAFLAVGALLLAASLFALVLHGDLILLVGVLLALAGIFVGTWALRSPYYVSYDDKGLTLESLHETEAIRWSEIESYRKLGTTRGVGPAVDDEHIQLPVIVHVIYRRQGTVRSRRLAIPGIAPAFVTDAQEYFTPLDRHIPEKKQR